MLPETLNGDDLVFVASDSTIRLKKHILPNRVPFPLLGRFRCDIRLVNIHDMSNGSVMFI